MIRQDNFSDLEVPESDHAVLCDFGLGRRTDDSSVALGICGPLFATAPEVLQGEDYESAADVYSYGVLIWDLLKLWMRLKPKSSLPKSLLEIICQCLSPRKNERRSSYELLGLLEHLESTISAETEENKMVEEREARQSVLEIVNEVSTTTRSGTSSSTGFITLSIDNW